MRRLLALCVILVLVFAASPTIAASPTDILQDGVIPFGASGELVVMIQARLRELGYFHFKATGNFQGMTQSAVVAFQTYQEDSDGNPFIADGRIGQQSLGALFSPTAQRAPIQQDVHIPRGKDADGSQTEIGRLTPWTEVKDKLTVGETYTLTDFNTGAELNIVYVEGGEHAEVECPSSDDTAKLKQIFGGDFSYFKRPMLISLEGSLVACSLQAQPHGESTTSGNGMSGHICLFFFESKAHVGGLSDAEHRDNVYTASGNVR